MPLTKVNTSGIADDAITSAKIATGVVSASDVADGTLTTAKLADSAITTAKINDSAVTTAKINDSAITLAKLSATGTKDATTFLRGDNTFAAAGLAWQAVVVADGSTQTTGVAGRGYFINTTSAAHTFVLPSSPTIGDTIALVDYAGTFDTNALTINPNGNKIEGGTDNLQLTGEREGVILTFTDATQGWLATSGINEGTDALSLAP